MTPTKHLIGTDRYVFQPFEDMTHLECLCRLSLRSRTVGAFLLRNRQTYSLVFGFRSHGIHTSLSPELAEAALLRSEAGLKGFRPSDRLRIHWRSFANTHARQTELDHLIEQTPQSESQFLLLAQQRHTEDLTQQDNRQPKQLFLFATYVIEPGECKTDYLEKLLAGLMHSYEALKGQKEQHDRAHYMQLLTQAFTDGFLHWEQQLNLRMGLQATPMNDEELWQYLWEQFNSQTAPPVPQCLVLQETSDALSLEEEIRDSTHAVSLLIRGEQGRSAHPQADREWVRVKNQFVSAIVLESKPAGFVSPTHQLYYLWQVLAQFPNCECVCELSAADRTLTRMTLQRLTRQSYTAMHRATAFKDVDVASQMRAKRSVEAQEQMVEGSLPIWLSVVVFIYHSDPKTLSEASQKFTHAFSQGEFIRETEISWRLWVRSLPIVDELLLNDGRRQLYLSNEAPGLMPLACPKPVDAQGIELITRSGNVPLYLDFVNQHLGMLILGATRSGKSVLAAEIYAWAIANGMHVVALDYPKPDGTTTYTDLVKFFGDDGAYFDVGSECNNLFQIPDVHHLSVSQQTERLNDYTEFLVKALDTMIMGTDTEGRLGKQVHTILWQALAAFFEQPQIKARYDRAFEAGLDSDEWREMPTLVDFVRFVRQFDLGVESASATEAIATIQLELQSWLVSRVGKAISQPSTIRTDAKLTVFALRNVGDNIEAAVLALSAQSLAFRKALEVTDSLLAIDESPILFKYNGIAQIIGQVCANGAKSGIRPLIIGQDPDSIAQSIAGAQILQNLNTQLIGAIQPSALPSYQRYLGIDATVLMPNTDESFRTDPVRLCSHWLLKANGRTIECSHYPSPELLAAVANNPKEQQARRRVLQHYGNKFEGYAAFAKLYAKTLKSGQSMDTILPQSSDVKLQAVSTTVPYLRRIG